MIKQNNAKFQHRVPQVDGLWDHIPTPNEFGINPFTQSQLNPDSNAAASHALTAEVPWQWLETAPDT
jgi:hypothetical protein